MAEIFNCPTCGGPLEVLQGAESTIRCPYCHNTVIVPDELRSGMRTGAAVSMQHRSQPSVSAVPSVNPQKLETEIRDLLAARQKINAIKLYRQVTGAGLKESKDAVEAIEAGGSLDASQLLPQPDHSALPVEDAVLFSQATQLVREGNKIAAIRLLRTRYDVSLKIAKDAADLLEKGQQVDIEWLKMRANQTASVRVRSPGESSGRDASSFIPVGCLLLILAVVGFIILMVVIR